MPETRPARDPAPRLRGKKKRIAVIDIGSNSIRLVVFEGLRRVPTPLFNEKVICGLGRGLTESGRLSEEGVSLALPNLARFARMARSMPVDRLELLATAAVREAVNGPEFMADVERLCGQPVTVLSGAEEARISALGVMAGTPEADGVMGDLGGGSLELVALNDGELGSSITLPLGPLRLIDAAKGDLAQAERIVDRQLAAVDWLPAGRGRNFYAVGGAWRALARIYMSQNNYPLRVIHGYALARRDAEGMLDLLSHLGRRSLARIPDVTRRRLETIPYAALLLGRVMEICRPEQLVWSSFGLREGFLFDQLPPKERAKDPLLEAVSEFAAREGRFGAIGEDLSDWTDALFPDEKPHWHRLRRAACHLSDFAWREHPDYRAAHAFTRLQHHPFSGLDHPGRAFLAYTVFTRYGGRLEDEGGDQVLALLGAKGRRRARILGLAVRLALTLSAGTRDLLRKTGLVYSDGQLSLVLPDDGSVPRGEAVDRRFNALVEAAEAKGALIQQGS